MPSINYIALIRSGTLLPFTSFFEEIGSPLDKLLSASKVPRKCLENPNSLVPMASATEFIRLGAQAEGLADLGLLAGQKTSLTQIGRFGRLIYSSFTLFEAIDTAQRQIHTNNNSAKFWFERKGHLVWICHRYLGDFGEGAYHASQCTIMLTLNLIKLATGPEFKPTAIHFQIPYSPEVCRYEALSEIPLVFGQAQSAIVIPIKLLSLPLHPERIFDPNTFEQEIIWLEQTAPARDYPGSVKQLLQAHLHDGYPGIQGVAESAGTSSRTLQRRLEEGSVPYSRLLEEVRFDLAIRLMSDPSIKLKDIAHALGYRDCANFTRAFRRWAGVPPNEFRSLRKEE